MYIDKNIDELTKQCQQIKKYMLERGQYNYYAILSLYELAVGELNDILNLKKKDAQMERKADRRILILHDKNYYEIKDDMLDQILVKALLSENDSEYLFTEKHSGIIKQSTFSAYMVRTKKELGITGFALKDLKYKKKIENMITERLYEPDSAERLLESCELILGEVIEKKDKMGEKETQKLIEAYNKIKEVISTLDKEE